MLPASLEHLSLTIMTDRQAIDTLLTLAEQYGGHANTVTSQSTGIVKGNHEHHDLECALANLKIT